MIKLSDMQLILLSTACQREDGSLLLPPPDTLGGQSLRIRKAVTALIKAGLAIEVEVLDEARSWRKVDDILFGVVIGDAGRERIAPAAEEGEMRQAAPLAPPTTSKIAGVIALLQRAEGASLTEMVEQTGWLPHTTRAALTGLRKKGHAIVRGDRDGVSIYRLAA